MNNASVSFYICIFLLVALFSSTALSNAKSASVNSSPKQSSKEMLSVLLQELKVDQRSAAQINRQREQNFLADKNLQAKKLKTLIDKEKEAKRNYEALKKTVDKKTVSLDKLTAELNERSHHLSDLYSVSRQVASDTQQDLMGSLTSTQYPLLTKILSPLLDKETLPGTAELSDLWWVLLKDIKASGETIVYDAEVYKRNGEITLEKALRTGPFTARTATHFLEYSGADSHLTELVEAPSLSIFKKIDMGNELDDTDFIDLVVDPSRGQLLAQLDQNATIIERIHQGGMVAYVIIFLGFLGLIFTLNKLLQLSKIQLGINKQLSSLDTINKNNPLGRILARGEDYKRQVIEMQREKQKEKQGEKQITEFAQEETLKELEVKLNESILRETPTLESGVGFIKLLATVAPLLGLLGTVTGMIATFNAITLFGTGDPKLMAGGISQALVTTVLGLVVAIPLLFGHSIVTNKVKSMIIVLSQESLALVAQAVSSKTTDSKIESSKIESSRDKR